MPRQTTKRSKRTNDHSEPIVTAQTYVTVSVRDRLADIAKRNHRTISGQLAAYLNEGMEREAATSK